MSTDIATLSEEEALALGLSTSTNGDDPDNPMVEIDSEDNFGLPPTDDAGRAVISYSQYVKIRKSTNPTRRLDNFALRVTVDSPRGPVRKTIQASKLQKWWGLGYRPTGFRQPARKAVASPKRPAVQVADQPKVYFCADAWPDCPRFFDTPAGLRFHVDKAHLGKMKRKPKAEAVAS